MPCVSTVFPASLHGLHRLYSLRVVPEPQMRHVPGKCLLRFALFRFLVRSYEHSGEQHGRLSTHDLYCLNGVPQVAQGIVTLLESA